MANWVELSVYGGGGNKVLVNLDAASTIRAAPSPNAGATQIIIAGLGPLDLLVNESMDDVAAWARGKQKDKPKV